MGSLADSTFTITWDAVAGAATYEAGRRKSGIGEKWADLKTTETATSTFGPAGGPDCGSTYEFRVRSYGDGKTYAAYCGATSVAAVEGARHREARCERALL